MLLADGSKSQFVTTPKEFCDTAMCTVHSQLHVTSSEKYLKAHNCCKKKEKYWELGPFSVCKHRVHFGMLTFTNHLLSLISRQLKFLALRGKRHERRWSLFHIAFCSCPCTWCLYIFFPQEVKGVPMKSTLAVKQPTGSGRPHTLKP